MLHFGSAFRDEKVRHEVCEFLLPKTPGITFGEHVNNLVPQVVWRGADHPCCTWRYGRGPRGVVRALAGVANLRPRWRAVVIIESRRGRDPRPGKLAALDSRV